MHRAHALNSRFAVQLLCIWRDNIIIIYNNKNNEYDLKFMVCIKITQGFGVEEYNLLLWEHNSNNYTEPKGNDISNN